MADLIPRIRAALSYLPNVQEKKMFRGTAFMVNDKLCVCESRGELMLRIDPVLHDEVVRKPGVRTVVMKGRPYLGWVYVKEDAVKTKQALNDWLTLALAFNSKAKSSKKKRQATPKQQETE